MPNKSQNNWSAYSYLFFVSFISLFLELLLIRWVSAEIRIFSYFRNLVLISCFIGLGIGFSLRKRRFSLLFSLALVLTLVVAVHPQTMVLGASLRDIPQYLAFPEFHVWFSSAEMPDLAKITIGLFLLAVVVVILAGIFVPFGQVLGRIFEESDNRIRDYSINLAGSLLGTWAFAVMSYLTTPPWMWFLAGGAGAILLIRPRSRRMIAGLALLIPLTYWTIDRDDKAIGVYWSPYQKLRLSREPGVISPHEQIPFYHLQINSVTYMYMFDLSRQQIEKHPSFYNAEQAPYYPYDLPYRFHSPPKRVLIMGAGAGNDAAAALRNGAGQVDAVEIDPTVARLGRLYHPERPYHDPRVNLIVDDARSFFKKTSARYDLIVFALLDSHTLTSNFTNINLDSYVYTRESIEEARAHLADGGIIAVRFAVERPWLGTKLGLLLDQVFGEPPLIISTPRSFQHLRGTIATLFLTGDLTETRRMIADDPDLRKAMSAKLFWLEDYDQLARLDQVDIPEDDWPYLYLKNRRLPTPQLLMTVVLGLLLVTAIRLWMPGGRIGPSHFLFLGAGFMLVEVHSISKAALLFGSTWIVNVAIISAILVMILGANLIALRHEIKSVRWWYIGLFVSLSLSFLIPVHQILIGGYMVRGIVAGAFYSAPLFFAGVIFARSIRRVAGIESAFAANMMGAAIGGMLESASYVFGLKAVVLIAILLYIGSAVTLRRMPVEPSS